MAAVFEHAEPTFGVFIISGPYYSGYTTNALEVARISSRDFLLTTVDNMEADMAAYVFKRKSFLRATIAEEIRELRDTLQGSRDPEVHRKLAILEKRVRESKKQKNDSDSSQKSTYLMNFTIIFLLIVIIVILIKK